MMIRETRKRIVMAAAGALLLALVVFAFVPRAVPVETATVARGPLQVMVEEEGITDVAHRYAVIAPVSAYLRRITLEVGDSVQRNQPLVWLESPRTPMLDARTRSEAMAQVRAAAATARTAASEHARTARLVAAGAATPQALENAAGAARRAAAELAAAEAALRRTESGGPQPLQRTLRAPVDGVLLAVRKRSEGQINPGDTLMVVGDARDLEVHVDVLSEDAVRIQIGTRALIVQWGGPAQLEARVRRIEPQGFTRVSSLGVEEQRVPVIATLTSPPEMWRSLGVGYRVLARFVVWSEPRVLQAPSGALFRTTDGWAAFVVAGGRARRRAVTIGQQAGLATQIVSGLQEGDIVIEHPANAVADGMRVR
jgi:HlyD family secretion protein